jgi:hypothetical protein
MTTTASISSVNAPQTQVTAAQQQQAATADAADINRL